MRRSFYTKYSKEAMEQVFTEGGKITHFENNGMGFYLKVNILNLANVILNSVHINIIYGANSFVPCEFFLEKIILNKSKGKNVKKENEIEKMIKHKQEEKFEDILVLLDAINGYQYIGKKFNFKEIDNIIKKLKKELSNIEIKLEGMVVDDLVNFCNQARKGIFDNEKYFLLAKKNEEINKQIKQLNPDYSFSLNDEHNLCTMLLNYLLFNNDLTKINKEIFNEKINKYLMTFCLINQKPEIIVNLINNNYINENEYFELINESKNSNFKDYFSFIESNLIKNKIEKNINKNNNSFLNKL